MIWYDMTRMIWHEWYDMILMIWYIHIILFYIPFQSVHCHIVPLSHRAAGPLCCCQKPTMRRCGGQCGLGDNGNGPETGRRGTRLWQTGSRPGLRPGLRPKLRPILLAPNWSWLTWFRIRIRLSIPYL